MTRPRKPETQERRLWLATTRRLMNHIYKKFQKKGQSSDLAWYKLKIETINKQYQDK